MEIGSKIAALLAKAESTTFPEEAETLFAKAQQLMAKHALTEADLEGARETEENPIEVVVVRVAIPYARERAHVLFAAAGANRVRPVRQVRGSVVDVHLVGFRRDLERVQLLYAALSVYATGAMIRAANRDNTQRFRRSFLVSFGQRIEQRLLEAEAAGVGERGLVLVGRSDLVNERVGELFPNLRRIVDRVGSREGFAAGVRAANLADLGQARVGGVGEVR
ncbi:MAG TPA: DUF2786 domain-containing protein [Candidatus Methylomirabilis sp.]|nr:DUF2786 domain-containing protein [Candidatus Methylomirabilis sp.]